MSLYDLEIVTKEYKQKISNLSIQNFIDISNSKEIGEYDDKDFIKMTMFYFGVKQIADISFENLNCKYNISTLNLLFIGKGDLETRKEMFFYYLNYDIFNIEQFAEWIFPELERNLDLNLSLFSELVFEKTKNPFSDSEKKNIFILFDNIMKLNKSPFILEEWYIDSWQEFEKIVNNPFLSELIAYGPFIDKINFVREFEYFYEESFELMYSEMDKREQYFSNIKFLNLLKKNLNLYQIFKEKTLLEIEMKEMNSFQNANFCDKIFSELQIVLNNSYTSRINHLNEKLFQLKS